jgi:DNA-binding phage protein
MKEKLSKSLKDPTKAARYLNRALEYGDPDNLRAAFLDLIRAKGGYHRVAAESGLSEWRIKLILWDDEESWKLLRMDKLLKGMGLRLMAKPRGKGSMTQRK